MKKWVTEIYAIHNITGEMATFSPDFYVEAPTFELAVAWCRKNAGWLHVIGELVAEIPTKEDETPDWEKKIDYEIIQQN